MCPNLPSLVKRMLATDTQWEAPVKGGEERASCKPSHTGSSRRTPPGPVAQTFTFENLDEKNFDCFGIAMCGV